jgi:hypothetical protein
MRRIRWATRDTPVAVELGTKEGQAGWAQRARLGRLFEELNEWNKGGWPMNGRRRAITVCGVLVTVAMLLYPPWAYPVKFATNNTLYVSESYGWLFSPPKSYRSDPKGLRFLAGSSLASDLERPVVLDFARLSLQVIGVGLLTGVALLLSKDKPAV